MTQKESLYKARSLYYGFFSKMLVFTTRPNRFDGLLEVLDVMISNPLDENSCEALKEIKEFIQTYHESGLCDEYDYIFNDPDSRALRDTASYYDEGVESGKKRVAVKNFLGKTKIRRNEANYYDNEDSVGFLVTFMHELIELILKGETQYETVQHCLFTEIINEFFDEFIVNLYEHDKANAYRSLAVVLNAFLEFERLYFDVKKPLPKEKPVVATATESCEYISDVEAKRRAENRAKREADSLVSSCSIEDSSTTEEFKDIL
ncbi:TorD/DmsD family molecular chaperone [Sulfurospirillum sp. 1612]|uniref:TorD/DmsD family molecular chaperone n=1 Tax=Sulfurospirillum sp. 1612 TaxID=3094835 RepID=UPI002F95DF42